MTKRTTKPERIAALVDQLESKIDQRSRAESAVRELGNEITGLNAAIHSIRYQIKSELKSRKRKIKKEQSNEQA